MPPNLTENILSGVLANIVTTILFFLTAWAVYLFFVIRERRRLLRFLGVSHRLPDLRILLSRVEVRPGGSAPVEGETIRDGYVGAAISKPEYDAALLLTKKINPAWLASIPNRIRDWLSSKYISFVRLETSIDVSPRHVDELPETNLILVGSNVYNAATKFYLNHSGQSFEFALKGGEGEYERIIRLRKYGMENVEVPGRSRNRELGLVQRVRDKRVGSVVLICAGLGAEATYGCTKYLADNLIALEEKYRQKEFGVCLAFEKVGGDVISSSPPRVVEEIVFDY